MSTTHTNPTEPVCLDPQTLEAIIEGVVSKLWGGGKGANLQRCEYQLR